MSDLPSNQSSSVPMPTPEPTPTTKTKIKELDFNRRAIQLNIASLLANIIINGSLSIATILLLLYTIDISTSTSEATKNNRRLIRAYMTWQTPITTDITSPKMRSTIIFKNVGQTPAYDAFGFRKAIILKLDNNIDKLAYTASVYPNTCNRKDGLGNYSLNIGAGDTKEMLIAKSDGISPNFVENFPIENIENFNTKQSVYLIHGIFCYSDIFKTQHYIKFCLLYEDVEHLKSNTYYLCENENNVDDN